MRVDPVKWQAKDFSQNFIADYKPYNFVDGEGVRCSLYVSGCPFACKGCYNKIAQNFHYGTAYTMKLEERIIEDLRADYCQGLTLLGGEPFLNTEVTLSLCRRVREEFGEKKDIWAWTGYDWEEIMRSSTDKKELLELLDVLVDGRFILDEFSYDLDFRGSANQRIIDVQKSLQVDEVILWHNGEYK